MSPAAASTNKQSAPACAGCSTAYYAVACSRKVPVIMIHQFTEAMRAQQLDWPGSRKEQEECARARLWWLWWLGCKGTRASVASLARSLSVIQLASIWWIPFQGWKLGSGSFHFCWRVTPPPPHILSHPRQGSVVIHASLFFNLPIFFAFIRVSLSFITLWRSLCVCARAEEKAVHSLFLPTVHGVITCNILQAMSRGGWQIYSPGRIRREWKNVWTPLKWTHFSSMVTVVALHTLKRTGCHYFLTDFSGLSGHRAAWEIIRFFCKTSKKSHSGSKMAEQRILLYSTVVWKESLFARGAVGVSNHSVTLYLA